LNLLVFQEQFPDEKACEAYLIQKRWPEGYVCERCGSKESWYLPGRRAFECQYCSAQKTITADTLFHRSRTPLKEWFLAIYLVTESKKGISGLELQKHLGHRDERRAYHMKGLIQKAMAARDSQYKLNGYVEIDEAFFGGAHAGKRGRGSENKTTVLVGVSVDNNDRPQYVKFETLPDLKGHTLERKVKEMVLKESFIVTDGYKGYSALNSNYEHLACTMNIPKLNQDYLPWVHILISNAKRFLLGTHHSVKHLSAYLAEFAWRFNRRFCNLFDRMLVSAIDYKPLYNLS
jgi:transposase-like protein